MELTPPMTELKDAVHGFTGSHKESRKNDVISVS